MFPVQWHIVQFDILELSWSFPAQEAEFIDFGEVYYI